MSAVAPGRSCAAHARSSSSWSSVRVRPRKSRVVAAGRRRGHRRWVRGLAACVWLDRFVWARAPNVAAWPSAIDLVGGIALAQEQNLARLRAPDARRPEAHQAKELSGVLPHVVERDVELVEVDGTSSLRRGVEPRGVELEVGSARTALVARDAPQVGGIHEQLALRDVHGRMSVTWSIGNGVVIAGPGDEAIDAAPPVDHARGVVRAPGQRDLHAAGPAHTRDAAAPAAVRRARRRDPGRGRHRDWYAVLQLQYTCRAQGVYRSYRPQGQDARLRGRRSRPWKEVHDPHGVRR
jgi:hypothetical protein